MHAPKTGTSFGNTVYPYACPRLPAAARLHFMSHTDIKEKLPSGMLMRKLVTEYPVSRGRQRVSDRSSTSHAVTRVRNLSDALHGHGRVIERGVLAPAHHRIGLSTLRHALVLTL
jgi:hypothetical protein